MMKATEVQHFWPSQQSQLASPLSSLSFEFFVRVRIVKSLGWNDMCIVVANVRAEHDPDSLPTLRKERLQIFAILLLVCYVFEVHQGVGKHEVTLSPEQVEQNSKWNYLDVLPIMLCAMFTRISICCFLRRLLAIEETWGRLLYFMIHFIWISNLPLVAGILFLCQPLQKV